MEQFIYQVQKVFLMVYQVIYGAGTTRLTNFLDSDDTRYMLEALKALGVRYTVSKNGTCCEVEGVNGPLNTPHPIELMTGNAGTVMRFLTAVLSLGQSDVVLTGGARMKQRPMDPLVDALRQGNAQITYLEKKIILLFAFVAVFVAEI